MSINPKALRAFSIMNLATQSGFLGHMIGLPDATKAHVIVSILQVVLATWFLVRVYRKTTPPTVTITYTPRPILAAKNLIIIDAEFEEA